jgi:hypothetical protein
MKNHCSGFLFFAMFLTPVFSQTTNQTIRGTISDIDSKLPITGAIVRVSGSDPVIACTTDVKGVFTIENMATGIKTIQVSFPAYEVKTIQDIEVIIGHEVDLNLTMQKAFPKADSCVIVSSNNGVPHNELPQISTHVISPDETRYYAGCDGQTSIITTSFAGIGSTQSAEHDIIIRGNSPKFLQWRLEGIEIACPYHWEDQNSSGNGMLALNNNLLATSNFYTGAFSSEYGNVLSGVYDVKLRTGDSNNFKAAARINIIYSDYTIESPIKKGYAGSFIANYRYYHIPLMIKLADPPGSRGMAPKMQDGTFKVVLPTQEQGTFTIFGLAGLSGLSTTTQTPEANSVLQTPDNRSMLPNIAQALDYDSYLGNIGINHTLNFHSGCSITTTVLFSGNGNKEDVYESIITKTDDGLGTFIFDTIGRNLNYNSRIKSVGLTGSMV